MTRDETLGGVPMYGYEAPDVSNRPGVWLSAEHAARVTRVLEAARAAAEMAALGNVRHTARKLVALQAALAALDQPDHREAT